MAVVLGAIAGALTRYYLTLICTRLLGHSAYGTLLVNLVGAWLMGVSTTAISLRLVRPTPEAALLFQTGFLGSLTTFSTYALDTVTLFKGHSVTLALIYWLGSAIVGVAGLYGGVLTAQWLR